MLKSQLYTHAERGKIVLTVFQKMNETTRKTEKFSIILIPGYRAYLQDLFALQDVRLMLINRTLKYQ